MRYNIHSVPFLREFSFDLTMIQQLSGKMRRTTSLTAIERLKPCQKSFVKLQNTHTLVRSLASSTSHTNSKSYCPLQALSPRNSLPVIPTPIANSSFGKGSRNMSSRTIQDGTMACTKPLKDQTSSSATTLVDEHTEPGNLRVISTGIYRSGYPYPEHHSYIHKVLKVKTVLYVFIHIPVDIQSRSNHDLRTLANPLRVPRGEELAGFCKSAGITHHVITMRPTNQAPGISLEHMREALTILMDKSNYPIVVHCKNGIVSTTRPLNAIHLIEHQLIIILATAPDGIGNWGLSKVDERFDYGRDSPGVRRCRR